LTFESIRNVWPWPNRLALDAAFAGCAWLGALSRDAKVAVSATELAILALSIWLVYTGDRWLDTRPFDWRALPTARHRFVARRRQPVFVVWLCLLTLDAALAFTGLTGPQLGAGFVLLALCLAHASSAQQPAIRRFTKELRIGIIFAAGVGMFFAGKPLEPGALPLLVANLALLAVACFANCALIAKWEIQIDEILGRQSLARTLARSTPKKAAIRPESLPALAWLTAALGFAGAAFSAPMFGLGLYGLLLALIDRYRQPRNLEGRRALADGLLGLIGVVLAVT